MTVAKTGAMPCADPICQSRGGYYPPDSHRPTRTRGLCRACYNRHLGLGTLDRFPLQKGNHTRVRFASQRKAEREALIAARVLLNEAREWRGYSNPTAPAWRTEAAVQAERTIREAEAFAADWLHRHSPAEAA
jgi:hypothetical protein